MDQVSKKIGIEAIHFAKMLDFLPYPFIVSEHREGKRLSIFHNTKFKQEIGYSIDEIPSIEEWFQLIYPDKTYRQQIMQEWKRGESMAKKIT